MSDQDNVIKDMADDICARISFRIGQMRGTGFPWQRKDAALLEEARQCIRAFETGYLNAARVQQETHANGAKLTRIRAILDGGR
ncbi:hypothetical protein [Aureimonas pseudogalii]|uniref:Uncharacterized protein n=1 Tax=Aureimonas pseudogalii TaxID=1744844 RepID=A0A7W6H4K9_9HYPH|nr:hypothetical protein [Aureimonas pseudogalii]MBB3997219.1 hypothetical protein [Aureimonas pseudogalii]